MKIKNLTRQYFDKYTKEPCALKMRQKDDEYKNEIRLARESHLLRVRNWKRMKIINTALFCTGI